ncbi:hypothetical protein [Methylomonas fluvii]|nr:hypothetical protein [Methylomonas fluvii]
MSITLHFTGKTANLLGNEPVLTGYAHRHIANFSSVSKA